MARDLPLAALEEGERIPARVVQRFGEPEAGYASLLLIRAAIDEATPVYRIIAVKREGGDGPGVVAVRLYQFDAEGADHPEVDGEEQAVVDFLLGEEGAFEGRVKGKRTTVSFADQTFVFEIHGLFGLKIERPLTAAGRVAVDDRPASLLLIRSSDKDRWCWVCDGGERIGFQP